MEQTVYMLKIETPLFIYDINVMYGNGSGSLHTRPYCYQNTLKNGIIHNV